MGVRQIIDRIIDVEGGYVDHPDDRGGPTCWGITEAVARANGFKGEMRDLPVDFAHRVYMQQYVIGPGFNVINGINSTIAEELVDTGVNMGPQVAATFLQRALNVANRAGRDYQDIVVDGDCGPATEKALRAFLAARGKDGELVMLTMLNSLQGARYIELCERREQNESFVYGWFRHRVTI